MRLARQTRNETSMHEASQTDLKQRVLQLEKALERCERRALANSFCGAAIHEVNNPLEAITNLVYLTRSQKNDPVLVSQNMEVVEQQLAILSKITSQALAFHRTQAEAQPCDLISIAESCLQLHAEKIARRGVRVETRFQRPAMTRAFETEILQVVSNIILNALDALPCNNGRISLRVRTYAQSVHITISDNGSGIPLHIAKQLFEPYMTSKAQGTGLGLWLSKRIVAKHNGTLRFRTCQREERSGTSFRVSLPLVRAVIAN